MEKNWAWGCMPVILEMVGHLKQEDCGTGWFGKKQDPISKITRIKRTGVVAHAVEHLPHKCSSTEFKPQYCQNKSH
jgi:hypothetical protein